MKIADLQGKTPDQLKDMVLNLKKELFNLRFQRSSGELTNTTRFKEVRRDVARVFTAMNTSDAASAKPAKAKAAKKPVAESKAKKTTKAKSAE